MHSSDSPHFSPDDIEFLLDGDEGFGVFPLRKHLASCADCRARLAEARSMVVALERLPDVRPVTGFGDRVMTRVQVFEPWHVTLSDTVRRMIPRSRPLRVLATLGAAGVGLSLSALAVWITLRGDLAIYAAELAWARLQTAAMGAIAGVVTAAFGESALDALRTGGLATAVVGVTGFVVILAAATFGLRGLLVVARRRAR